MTADAGTFHKPFRPVAGRIRGILPPGRLGVYILVVGLVGIVLLAYGLLNLPLGHPELLIVLYVMIFALESAPIKLSGTPLRGSNLSVSAAIDFAALLIFGPAGAILLNSGSALAYILKEKRPFYKRFFTTATLLTSAGSSSLVYVLAGGGSPIGLDTRNLIAAGLAAIAYFLTNSCLVSEAISLQTERPFRSILSNWQWLFLQMLTSLAVGLVMGLAYANGYGSILFLLAPLLLVFPWYSIYYYVQKSRQISEQHEQLSISNAELERANRVLDLRLHSLRSLHNIGISLNSAQDLPAILNEILHSVVGLVAADATAVFLDQEGQRPAIAGHIGLSPQYLEGAEMALNGSGIRAMREGHTLVLDKNNGHSAMLSAAAEREGIRSVACLPLRVDGEVVGSLDVSFKSDHVFGEEELNLLRTLAEQAAVAIHNSRLTEQIHESYLSTIRALAATEEAKDQYTRGHSEVVRQLAVATGRQMGLSPHQIELLNIGALFHDIGKIGTADSILKKPAKLDDEEWEEMRQHPVIGERILSKVPALAEVLPIVRHHHERFDGKGYPDGICAGEQLLAAIIATCDSYQAMTSDRPYRKALGHNYAIEEIRRDSGTQFVPEVAEAFITAVDNQPVQYLAGTHLEPALLLRKSNHRTGKSSDIQNSSTSGTALVAKT